MFLFKNSKNKLRRISLNMLVYGFIGAIVCFILNSVFSLFGLLLIPFCASFCIGFVLFIISVILSIVKSLMNNCK